MDTATRDSPNGTNTRSAMLQHMIKEKRAQTSRSSRSRELSGETLAGESQSSPLSGASSGNRLGTQRTNSGRGSIAKSAPKEMGLREMQEHVSKLNKQNFDLKLEIFHRRERSEILESRVQKLEGLEDENEELRSANEHLLLNMDARDAEIDKRETVIEEAVAMICELEARIEDLELDLKLAKQDVQEQQSGRAHPQLQVEPPSSPLQDEDHVYSPNHTGSGLLDNHPGTGNALKPNPCSSPTRQPSFLRDSKRSSAALRSYYTSRNHSFASLRPSSVLSDDEFNDELERQMQSPRLSILSESGFSSIYGHKRGKSSTPVQASTGSNTSSPPRSEDSHIRRAAQREARINDWVEENKRVEQPRTPERRASQPSSDRRFSSISEVLQKVPSASSQQSAQGSPGSKETTTNASQERGGKQRHGQRSPNKSLRRSAKAHEKLSSQPGSVFGSNHLPPTPETMSTATVAGNSSTQSIIPEKSTADSRLLITNGFASLIGQDQAESARQQRHKVDRVGHADAFETLEDDAGSSGAEQSVCGMVEDDARYHEEASFMGAPIKSTRFGSELPSRPSLTHHTTDPRFNGDGFSPSQASRTLSYPSPSGGSRKASSQLSPASKRSSGVPSERTVTSFTRPGQHPVESPVNSHSPIEEVEVQPNQDSKPSRAASTSNRFHPRNLLGRFKSQGPDTVPNVDDEAPVRPESRQRRPRPSSLVAARPDTSDGVNDVPSKIPDRPKWSIRRRSAIIDRNALDLGKETKHDLRPVSASGQSFTDDEGKLRGFGKSAGARIKGGLGFKH